MKNKKLFIFSSICLLLALFGIGVKLYQNAQKSKVSKIESSVFEREYSPSVGNKDAKVTMVEYLDPECESCRAFYPYVKRILNDFNGQVRLVVRYAPFHANSQFAVKILEAARKQGKYWEAMELLFHYQPAWGSHHNPRPELIWNYLPEIGLDIEKIKTDMNDPEISKIIQQDIADGQKLGVRMTPTFFVNGRQLERFGYEYLRDLVKEELEK